MKSLRKSFLNKSTKVLISLSLQLSNSKDTSSNEKGGDLGFFEKDLIGAEFDEAAFAMNVGEVSEIVSTDYGYFHIIKLTDIEVETVQVF